MQNSLDRKTMKTILTFSLLILLSACRPNRNEEISKIIIETPKNFFFRIDFNNHDHYDSYDSTLTRSYNFGDTTLNVWLTHEERNNLYKIIIENDFFNLPHSIPNDTTKSFITPSKDDYVVVYINGQIKNRVRVNRGGSPLDTNAVRRFNNVFNYIENILTKTKKYKNLAPSNIVSM